ncbi:hypothetical protein GGR54DRAFT_583211 [Hypoxylon sp. NC1633]|nr:hypothetical protein GGR54DRAFT_583211 [Hypoxylon sp. NC1633]
MAKTRPLCLVCDTVEGKYKCPQCNLFTCSLPCSREHRDNHPPLDASTVLWLTDNNTTSASDGGSQDGRQESTPAKENADIADMPEYKALARKYPNLESLLWNIAAATDPPIDNGGSNAKLGTSHGFNKGYRKANQPWTKDIGYENGIKVLRKTRDAPGNDRDALKEYCELVRLYLARKESSAEAVRKTREQFPEDDVKAIKDLMRSEGADAS